jgi:hypothetical protein
MKKAILLTATALAITTAAHAQWNGGGENRTVNVTVNRYNYYQNNNGWGNRGNCGGSQWGYNGYGQPIPNGLGWTMFGINAFFNLFGGPVAPAAAYVQYPVYQSPAPVIVR